MTASESLLDRVASELGQPAALGDGVAGSILATSALRYGSQVDEDLTQPTGFDPQAAALFEAIVESAFLVANADGEFDDVERGAFVRVVLSACDGAVTERQLTALLADLGDLLSEDGVDKRVKMVAHTIAKAEQAREVLRVAGLIAHVSGGISDVERAVLDKLASEFRLPPGTLEEALADVRRALAE